jgi:hypothetical protein
MLVIGYIYLHTGVAFTRHLTPFLGWTVCSRVRLEVVVRHSTLKEHASLVDHEVANVVDGKPWIDQEISESESREFKADIESLACHSSRPYSYSVLCKRIRT